MDAESAGARFIDAFNDIENHMRSALQLDTHVEFGKLAREYGERKHLPQQHRDALSAFADLRNAISHGRYYAGRPIAEPVGPVVVEIEALRALIKTPPTAIAVLGSTTVRTVAPDNPISVALDLVREFDYSQLPVYGGNQYVGLLTTNAIARWLAHQLAANDGLAESADVNQVLQFAEPFERASFVPRAIAAADAVYRLSRGGDGGKPVSALIVTHDGKPAQLPLAVVVAHDISALTSALAFPS